MSIAKILLIGLAIVLVLRAGKTVHNTLVDTMDAFFSSKSHYLDEQNTDIQSQLDALSARLDAMTQAEEEQTKLLSDYSFELDVWTDAPGADAVFSAVPKTWMEGDSAYISFQLPGEEAIRSDCKWDGAFLTAEVPLEAKNGYSICLTVAHADGALEQQMLYDYTVENLAKELTVGCEVTWGTAKFRFNEEVLEMEVVDGEVHVTRPGVAGEEVYFSNVYYVLYLCRADGHEEVDRYELYSALPLDSEVSGYGPDVWCYGEPTFLIPDIQDGDGLELWAKAEMSNGMTAATMAGSWAYNNGEFIAAVPVE